jgi:hypothetical protein
VITDAIIRFLATILTKVVDLFPSAPIVASGNGLADGTVCCAILMITNISVLINSSSIRDNHGNTGVAALVNATPLPILIDFYWFGFIVGCTFAIAAAFFIVRILLLFWQQVKW